MVHCVTVMRQVPDVSDLFPGRDVCQLSDSAMSSYACESLDWFSRDVVLDWSVVYDRTRRKRTLKCETDQETVFVVERKIRSGDWKDLPQQVQADEDFAFAFTGFQGDDGYASRGSVKSREGAYLLKDVFGIPMPPHTFGDGWVASVEVDESSLLDKDYSNWGDIRSEDWSKPVSCVDDLLTDVAWLVTIGSFDIKPEHVFVNDDGEYCFIDVHCKEIPGGLTGDIRVRKRVVELMEYLGLPRILYQVVYRRSWDIAAWVIDNYDDVIPDELRLVLNVADCVEPRLQYPTRSFEGVVDQFSPVEQAFIRSDCWACVDDVLDEHIDTQVARSV